MVVIITSPYHLLNQMARHFHISQNQVQFREELPLSITVDNFSLDLQVA